MSTNKIHEKDDSLENYSLFLLNELQSQKQIDSVHLSEFVKLFAETGFPCAPSGKGVSALYDYCQNYYNQQFSNAEMTCSEVISGLYSLFWLSFILSDTQKKETMNRLVHNEPLIQMLSLINRHKGITHAQLAEKMELTQRDLLCLILLTHQSSLQGKSCKLYSTMGKNEGKMYFIEPDGKYLLDMAADCTGTSGEKDSLQQN